MEKKFCLRRLGLVFILISFVSSLSFAQSAVENASSAGSAGSVGQGAVQQDVADTGAANADAANTDGTKQGGSKQDVTKQKKEKKSGDDLVFAEPSLVSGLLSFSEITLFSIGLNQWDRRVLKEEYAQVNWSTMKKNLTSKWFWDYDPFSTNQIGHPYQGSVYFSMARSTGFNYWQSLAFTVYGSTLWELLFETDPPSVHDEIMTTIPASFLGESLHRMYFITNDYLPFLSWVVSPADAVNQLLLGKKLKRPDGELTELSFFAGAATGENTVHTEDPLIGTDSSGVSGKAIVGLNLVYGSPYYHFTKEPFDQFDFYGFAALERDRDYYAVLFGNAPVWSWGIVPLEDYGTTLAVKLHYHYAQAPCFNFNNNALGLSLAQSIPAGSWKFSWEANLNWAFLVGVDYYALDSTGSYTTSDGEDRRVFDYGMGANADLKFRLEQPVFGDLSFYAGLTAEHTLPPAVIPEASSGYALMLYGKAEYSHKIAGMFSLGCNYLWYKKWAWFYDDYDMDQFEQMGSVFVKIDLL